MTKIVAGVALFAIVVGVAYISKCAYRNAGAAMPDQPEALTQFRAQYGRLCVLTAKAIKQGHALDKVAEAVKGKGRDAAPVYVILRAQRAIVQTGVQLCYGNGTTLDAIADICRELRSVIESEWMLELPKFAEVA